MEIYNLTDNDKIIITNAVRDYVYANKNKKHDSFVLAGEFDNKFKWQFMFNGMFNETLHLSDILFPIFWNISACDEYNNQYDVNVNTLSDIFDDNDALINL